MKYNELCRCNKDDWKEFSTSILSCSKKLEHEYGETVYLTSFQGDMVEIGTTISKIYFRFIIVRSWMYFEYSTNTRYNWNGDIKSLPIDEKHLSITRFIERIQSCKTTSEIEKKILAISLDDGKRTVKKEELSPLESPFKSELVIVASNTVQSSNMADYKSQIVSALATINTTPKTESELLQATIDIANISTAEKKIKDIQDKLFTGELATIQEDLKVIAKAFLDVKKPLKKNVEKAKEAIKNQAISDAKKKYFDAIGKSVFLIEITQLLEASLKGKRKAESKNLALEAVIEEQVGVVKAKDAILENVLRETSDFKQYFTESQYQKGIISYIKAGETAENIVEKIASQVETIKLKQELAEVARKKDAEAKEQAERKQAEPVGKFDFSNVEATIINDGTETPLELAKNILIEEPNKEVRPPKFEAVVTSTVSTTERTQHLDESCLNTVDQLFKQGIEQYNQLLEQGEIEYYSEINDGILTVQARIKPDE